MSENVERLNNLELKFMDHEQLIEQLSDEVALCHRRIDELVRENNALKQMVENLGPENEASPDE